MLIENFMTKNVVSVEMDDSLSLVKEIFERTGFHHLLVLESGRLHGVISDRDLLRSISPKIGTLCATTKDMATLNKKAHQIMTRELYTLMADANFYDAVEVFVEQKVSCIPIIDESNKAIGIVSWRDVMSVLDQLRKSKKA